MEEVLINGPEGKLHGFYRHSKNPKNISLVLHPRNCTENSLDNNIVSTLFEVFSNNNFSTLKINFRGVQKSDGEIEEDGLGELSDAATALDWLQGQNQDTNSCLIGGIDFGAWIGSQLLMRRPEINRFIVISPQPNVYDFSFLSPCPASGLMVYGKNDELVPLDNINSLNKRLSTQVGIKIEFQEIEGANHFFSNKKKELSFVLDKYIKKESALY